MLEILDVKDLDKKSLNIKKRRTKKRQIVLSDTNRRFNDFINKIKYRNNGNYTDIPHFVITKMGYIYNIFDPHYSSNTFDVVSLDNKQIKIAMENLGFLKKNTITGILHNWIGDPYRSEPYVKKWRNNFYWDPYTNEQLESLKKLNDYLCDNFDIPKNIVSNQGFFRNSIYFNGTLCKSNFSTIYSDINPSFKFNEIQ